jgi:hypothetical protein
MTTQPPTLSKMPRTSRRTSTKKTRPQLKTNKLKTTPSLSHQLIQRTKDQSANCFSPTGALLESKVITVPISIQNSAGSSSREAEQSTAVRTGGVPCCIQRFATTHTSLGPATRLDAKNVTLKIIKCQGTKPRIMVTSLFYGRNKSKNR